MATFAYEAGLRLGMTKSAGGNMKCTRLGAGVGAVGGGIIGALLKAKTRKQRVLNALKGVGIGGLAGGGLGLAADAHGILRDTVDDYIDSFRPPDVRHPYFDFDWLPERIPVVLPLDLRVWVSVPQAGAFWVRCEKPRAASNACATSCLEPVSAVSPAESLVT